MSTVGYATLAIPTALRIEIPRYLTYLFVARDSRRQQQNVLSCDQ